ncbi:MAG TPA: hypothetical protein VHG51_03075, partial [Longimicrobiaceae bacterium]|nr:hypothetical protein [Longimicrobiaceae bacterium]
MSTRATRRRQGAALAVLAVGLLGACDGDNLFAPGSSGRPNPGSGNGSGRDTLAPTVAILTPVEDATAAAGDSLAVRVSLADANGLATLELSGYSAGSGGGIERFARRTITVGSAQDTVR